MQNSFTEDDVKKLVAAINFVSANLELKQGCGSFENSIEWTRHMGFLQREIVPKVRDHILEVKAVHEAEKPKPRSRAKK